MSDPIEFTTEPLQEPLASRDAAISCLVRLSPRNGGTARSEAARASIDPAGETLPLSRLVTVAAEFGLEAARVELDWQGLKTAASAHPVLIVRGNTEVVVVTGGGRCRVGVPGEVDKMSKTFAPASLGVISNV